MKNAKGPFPPAWTWWVDEAMPAWVKEHYSPKENWKGKPFSEVDARFFFRGIEDLSELFTEERGQKLPDYFAHPKFRSSYLLYYFPLQAAKFLTLFDLYPDAIEAALRHAKRGGVLRVADLGSGPGTASLALILHLMNRPELPEKIEFHWWDTSRQIMDDGKKLMELLCSSFPKLRDRVSVVMHPDSWWRASESLKPTSLIFMGHVLNETLGLLPPPPRERAVHSPEPKSDTDTDTDADTDTEDDFEIEPAKPGATPAFRSFVKLIEKMEGGGALLIEPADRRPSQLLSRIRDQILGNEILQPTAESLWGPCLHAGNCPLASGRDWCHFSIPTEIPGKWFKTFSKMLSSERTWVKFSYLWFASAKEHAPLPLRGMKRVISDPLRSTIGPGPSNVLICEPNQPGRMPLATGDKLWRGDIVEIQEPKGPRPSIPKPLDRPKRR